jgi:DNA-binding MarR family transcriptional regulator
MDFQDPGNKGIMVLGLMDVKKDGGLIAEITQLSKALHRRTTEEQLGMRLKAYLTLSHVRDHPGTTQQELESAILMDANGVVLILNEAEAAGFSIRRRDPNDRRRHIVELTEAGRKALERADAGRETLEGALLEPLSAEERETFRALLRKVLAGALTPVPDRS